MGTFFGARFQFEWWIAFLLFLAAALSFFDRPVLSVLVPTLTSEFHMTNAAYSRVVFAFQLSYTVMFSAGGQLMDRLGTRIGMAWTPGVWSLASAAHAVATGPLSLGVARLFLGVGEGACFPAATKGAVEWFPLEKRALAIGIANGGSAFGAVIAPPLTAIIAIRFGWRKSTPDKRSSAVHCDRLCARGLLMSDAASTHPHPKRPIPALRGDISGPSNA